MGDAGKTIRLKRLFDKHGKAVLFASAYHMTSVEPFPWQVEVETSVQVTFILFKRFSG